VTFATKSCAEIELRMGRGIVCLGSSVMASSDLGLRRLLGGFHFVLIMVLVLNDCKFKNQVAVMLGEAPGALREIDGVLGPTALGIARIELDWEHKCLR